MAARGGGRVCTTDLRAVGASVPAVGGLLERWYRKATASPAGVSGEERVVVKPPYLHGKHNAKFGVKSGCGPKKLHSKFRMLPTSSFFCYHGAQEAPGHGTRLYREAGGGTRGALDGFSVNSPRVCERTIGARGADVLP